MSYTLFINRDLLRFFKGGKLCFILQLVKKVIEINQEAVQSPEIINEDPYDKGWLVRLDPSNPEDLNQLMSASEYETFLESLGH